MNNKRIKKARRSNKRKLIVILLIFGVPVHTELIESNTKARPDTK